MKSLRNGLVLAAFFFSWLAQAGFNPKITDFFPKSGPPGTEVTITGTDLYPVDAVYFGTDESTRATVVSQTSTKVVVTVPPTAISSPITLYSFSIPTTSSQTFYLPPSISDFLPRKGTIGTQVTINGTGFSIPGFFTYVFFNGVSAPQGQVTSDTQITVLVPKGASTGLITVSNKFGVADSALYFYLNPIITSFTNRVATGQNLQIYGTSFLGVTSVSLAGRALNYSILSGTNLQVTIPSTAVDGPLSVTSPGGSFITSSNLLILPTVTGFTPSGGPAGTVVTIQGTGLSKTTAVNFGSLASPAVTNINSSTVNAVVPTGIKTAPITLVTSNGTNTTTAVFYAPPTIDSFSPLTGIPGTSVTLTGKNFDAASQVLLGVVPLPDFQVLSSTQIKVSAPTNIISAKFQVTTPGGTATSGSAFNVLGPQPTLDGFSPTLGPIGALVTLSGQNLTSATSVKFGTVSASFQVSGANLIATVPAGAVTAPISVTTPYGSVTSGSSFSVGTSANVVTFLNASLSPALSYSPVSFDFQVNNRGPLTASNLVVTLTYSGSLKFVSGSGTPDFDHFGTTAVFRYGPVANGSSVNGSLVLQAGPATNVTVTAVATSSTTIPSGGANQAVQLVPVVSPSLALLLVDPLEILLQWPSPATTYRLESSPALASTNWLSVTNVPVDDGVTKQLLVPLTGRGTYYRLRYPGSP
jgi:hypothetical protein